MKAPTLTTERIIADAEIAATFLRALIDKGVPMPSAVSLTSSYLLAYQSMRAQQEGPREPWEEGS